MLLVERCAPSERVGAVPVERVVVVLLVERVGVALVERVVVVLVLLVARCALSERVGVVPVERVLVLLVERVAVALVGRPERISVELLTDCERFTVLPPRADSPRDTLPFERDTAVCELPNVRVLLFTTPRSATAPRWL